METPRGEVNWFRRVIFVEISTVAVIVGSILFWTLRHLVLEILVGIVLAVMVEPLVRLLGRVGMRRTMAGVLVFVILLAAVVVVVFFLTVPIVDAAIRFSHQLPALVNQVKNNKGRLGHLIVQLHLNTYIQTSSTKITQMISSAATPAFLAAKQVVSTIVNLSTIFILAVFLCLQGPRILSGASQLLAPPVEARARLIFGETAVAVTRYVLGNLFTSVVFAVVVGVSLSILGVPYAGVLALWAGIADLLPLVGGLLAAIPTLLVALLHSTGTGVVMLVVVLVYLQVENHVLNPWVYSRAVRLNPLWILLAVLIGGQLAKVEGALLAIPVASALQVFGKHLWDSSFVRRSTGRIGGLQNDSGLWRGDEVDGTPQ